MIRTRTDPRRHYLLEEVASLAVTLQCRYHVVRRPEPIFITIVAGIATRTLNRLN